MTTLPPCPDACSLCNSPRLVLHRWFDVRELEQDWKTGLGFNPFEKLDAGETLYQYRCLDCDLRFYSPAICGDGKFYEELSGRFAWYYEKDKWEFDTAIDLLGDLPGVVDVLEVGCGQGHFLKRIRHAFNAEGVELNQGAVAECRQQGLNVSGVALGELDKEFDMVVAFEVLEHVDVPSTFMLQAIEKLRPGGYLMIAVPDPDGYFSETEKVLLDMPPHHVLSFSKRTLEKMAEVLNLTHIVTKQEPLRFAHYRSYASNFISAKRIESAHETFVQKLIRKTIGRPLHALTRAVDRRLDNLDDRLAELALAVTYQSAKDKMLGQTHLALYRKF
ncbi:class I SAM-dependent methyltransferase [Herbaspirillum lusitanum]|uniref:class I SAM-dependent methyltransferase n=1 Tax=Herbaspirillum lusitanum TaxID=213312 RepID=UPI0022374839|nr:class I SAM-dependent methyltransferase [Herbaspirillum lusitanum]MCW5296898.1 class I SAM-dependent methyltransferase [Herbaspirillum lusitanum]